MTKKATKTGKALEHLVADAYRNMGARVTHDVELAGHQIDVYVELETPDRALHRIAVEAKNHTRPVGIAIVRDFSNVVARLRRERLIDQGLIVSAVGFSKQARNAARSEGLRLLEVADLDEMVAEAQATRRPAFPRVRPSSSGPMPPCPYRGLLAFREQDAPFYFGREVFTGRLVEVVRQRAPFVVVVGPSGSGKSSVVFAGLIPYLCQEAAGWVVAHFRPGSHPFGELANALLPLLEPEMSETDRLVEIPKATKVLREGDLSLRRVAERVLRKSPGVGGVLLVADQFEELYTLCPELEARRRFLDVLLAALDGEAERPEPALTVMLTLRADFMGQALAYRPFADALDQAHKLMLGPMTREELEGAIVRPARRQGVAFEEGLVARILGDVGGEPGKLPLLEFALTHLWQRQEFGWLTHAAYEAIGKVEGALTHYADQVYGGLGEDEQEQARRLFVQLMRPGEGTEDTRQLATRAELGEMDWGLVRQLADARLVVTDRDPAGHEVVEIAHEALIRGWELLRMWMQEDRGFRVWQERLRTALRQWDASDQDEGGLLRGRPLVEAERWLAERGDDLGERERMYIRESRSLLELEEAVDIIGRTRELDEVLDRILEQVERVVRGDAFDIMLLAGDGNVRVVRWRGYEPSQATDQEMRTDYSLKEIPSLLRMTQTGEPIIVTDTATDHDWTPLEGREWLRSYVGAPIRVSGLTVGFLNVNSTKSGQFDSADARRLQAFASHAATAIQNAQLYRELLNHAEQLERRVQEGTAQLQAQYAQLEAILDSSSDGIIVTDGQGEILQTNPIVQTWLSRTLLPEDAARLHEAVHDLAGRAEERPETVLELTGMDLQLSAAPITEPGMDEAAAVIAIHDISHLEALDRMKSRFVSNVSHELRIPITTIKLYAALMQRSPEKWKEYLDVLVQEADRQALLVEDILQISQFDSGRLEMKPRSTPLNELTEMSVLNHRVLAEGRSLTLEHRPAEPEPVALVDPDRLAQVLTNLIANAINYTPEGGEVTVSTRKKEAEGRVWATVTVADTGMGIPEYELPHVFERFFRGEQPRAMQVSGTGLGLAIAKEIVELQGGRVTVESEVDVGTTFTVWLPLAE